MIMSRQYFQGIFTPTHPEKYKGNVKNIVYRSSWELKALRWCDLNPSVVSYSSEETIVPYFNELDGKLHRYFVDLLIVVKTQSGLKTYLIEIKPKCQVERPVQPKRGSKKTYFKSIDEWIVNQQKWSAAKEYASKRGWEFKILTEKELGIK